MALAIDTGQLELYVLASSKGSLKGMSNSDATITDPANMLKKRTCRSAIHDLFKTHIKILSNYWYKDTYGEGEESNYEHL